MAIDGAEKNEEEPPSPLLDENVRDDVKTQGHQEHRLSGFNAYKVPFPHACLSS